MFKNLGFHKSKHAAQIEKVVKAVEDYFKEHEAEIRIRLKNEKQLSDEQIDRVIEKTKQDAKLAIPEILKKNLKEVIGGLVKEENKLKEEHKPPVQVL